MPKININEIDNTKAGELAYENFSVVVPGFIDSAAASEYDDRSFDENGVCELKTIEQFEHLVGESDPGSTTKARTFATPYSFTTDSGTTAVVRLSAEDYYQTYFGYVYDVEEITEPAATKGRLVFKEGDNYYEATKATSWVENNNYCVIAKGNEGNDEQEFISEGYKIAARLISLGYTVLYKKLNNEDPTSADFWAGLKDKANYDFRYIIPGIYNERVYERIVEVVKCRNKKETEFLTETEVNGRGDAIALLDIIEDDLNVGTKATQATIISAIKSQVNGWSNMLAAPAGKYAAIFTPRVIYSDDEEMPASFHYLACGAKAFENYNEWYAVAGYTRGVSSVAVKGTTMKLGDIAVNALQPRYTTDANSLQFAVNPITCERGNYYLWGNRTANLLDNKGLVASHFLNIRQLCCTLKKEIYVACRSLTFDPNSDVLWINFCNKIRPILEKMKSDQGIKDYKFVKVRTNVKALMRAKIRIVPIEAVEDFDIGVYLEDSISGIKAEADEE